jgi:predicted GNAT family N-acyltransferase
MAAYRALRKQGYQPPRVEGSYDLSRRATSEAEIRLGQVISDRDPARKRKGTKLMEGMLEIADHGMVGKAPERGGKKRLAMKARQ